MSTIEAGPETAHSADGHDHDHPSFLAHHFDTPEQQFDSGKLGIWLFLVTEILFFSGMFCAYAIFRMLRPDVFEGCSQFLNTKLGAINTGVLLFSSLTMAWAVRCSQVEDNKGLVGMLAATLSCAMIFLGVKAIEYSHKWEMGLLPAGLFVYDPANPHPPRPAPPEGPWAIFDPAYWTYLDYICAPFALIFVGVVIWLIYSLVTANKFHLAVAKPLTVASMCFFVGVGLGTILESGGSESHVGEHHAGEAHAAADDGHDHPDGETHESGEAVAAVIVEPNTNEILVVGDESGNKDETAVRQRLATDSTNSGIQSEIAARQRQSSVAGTSIVTEDAEITGAIEKVESEVLTARQAGVFFSIYYCMTGIHAIHILAGIAVLVWLLVRAVRHDFNRQYFGPVDYVGLYWHLVDLIWIYLFPLLYLIR
ncbi:MAG: cytochrome c oxidase subunit 3 [Rubripirellula sp.]|nr:cytochrome c oxidase subunit 3 [Rubripirellula sp.]